MQLIKKTEASTPGMKFLISCEYFNKADESIHATDFTVDFGQSQLNSFDIDKSKFVSAA
tara:strand:+ start:384 stop:560 length:177 start_codon:yes stop_codon:yes gene_type:complete